MNLSLGVQKEFAVTGIFSKNPSEIWTWERNSYLLPTCWKGILNYIDMKLPSPWFSSSLKVMWLILRSKHKNFLLQLVPNQFTTVTQWHPEEKSWFIYRCPEHTEEKLESETLGTNPPIYSSIPLSTHPPPMHSSIRPSTKCLEDLLCARHWRCRW